MPNSRRDGISSAIAPEDDADSARYCDDDPFCIDLERLRTRSICSVLSYWVGMGPKGAIVDPSRLRIFRTTKSLVSDSISSSPADAGWG